MGNQRGNTWSKNHTTLEPCRSCPNFWKFSWDDTALLDISSDIDYVLANTGYEKLFYVGYSMGTTKYCVLLSELPEYNDKIIAGFLMGPATSMTNAALTIADKAENIQDYLHDQGGNQKYKTSSRQWIYENNIF